MKAPKPEGDLCVQEAYRAMQIIVLNFAVLGLDDRTGGRL
jgi:hypothetical protein